MKLDAPASTVPEDGRGPADLSEERRRRAEIRRDSGLIQAVSGLRALELHPIALGDSGRGAASLLRPVMSPTPYSDVG